MVPLSPGSEVDTEIAPVCSGGDLELVCMNGGGFLQWSYTTSGVLRSLLIVDSHTPNFLPHLITINNTPFNISRISPHDSLPLKSRLLIGSINESLNETEVICQDIETGNSSSTTLKVISKEVKKILRH